MDKSKVSQTGGIEWDMTWDFWPGDIPEKEWAVIELQQIMSEVTPTKRW